MSEEVVTALVVEDEQLIRSLIVDHLVYAGVTVVEAENADEAITILQRRNDIRVVFTDVNMPGSMDGIKLAAYVRHRWPPIKIIVTSGLLHKAPPDLSEGARFFSKPYDLPEIATAVTEMLR